MRLGLAEGERDVTRDVEIAVLIVAASVNNCIIYIYKEKRNNRVLLRGSRHIWRSRRQDIYRSWWLTAAAACNVSRVDDRIFIDAGG